MFSRFPRFLLALASLAMQACQPAVHSISKTEAGIGADKHARPVLSSTTVTENERVRAPTVLDSPLNRVGQITINEENRGVRYTRPVCTAVAIDPRHILTAAHCLDTEDPFLLSDPKWQFSPGKNGESKDQLTVTLTHFALFAGPRYEPGYDLALAETVETIPFDALAIEPQPEEIGLTAFSIGYPIALSPVFGEHAGWAWMARGLLTGNEIHGLTGAESVFTTNQCLATGDSGAPVFSRDSLDAPGLEGTSWKLHGILSHAARNPECRGLGRRIDVEVSNWIQKTISSH